MTSTDCSGQVSDMKNGKEILAAEIVACATKGIDVSFSIRKNGMVILEMTYLDKAAFVDMDIRLLQQSKCQDYEMARAIREMRLFLYKQWEGEFIGRNNPEPH
jgi:hypothetical protein